MGKNRLNIVAATGGTFGHLAPALLIAEELESRGHSVRFIVSGRDQDAKMVSARGFAWDSIAAVTMPRRPGPGQISSLIKASSSVKACRRIFRNTSADVVLAAGGFVAAPAAAAARTLQIPVVVTEADSHLGLANRLGSRFARVLCSAYPLASYRDRQRVTGRPVSPEFFSVDRSESRRTLGINDHEKVLVVVGGSGGATHLNEIVFDTFANSQDELSDLTVIHVTGKRDWADFSARPARNPGYSIIEFSDDMPTLFGAADLVLSRAGGSVFELAAAGRACILVPFPGATGDHQMKNARFFERSGGAVVVHDSDLTSDWLRSTVADLLLAGDSSERIAQMELAMRSMAKPDAVRSIADIIEELGCEHHRIESTPKPLGGRRFHMIGGGGAGVSSLALICEAMGAEVTCCDRQSSVYSELLLQNDVPFIVGHSIDHLADPENLEVVKSSALPDDNPELEGARSAGLKVWLRGELLGELSRFRPTIAVAGAHGKSTTTAMIGRVLAEVGRDPAMVLGAIDTAINSNTRTGGGWLVAEADESDRSLKYLRPRIIVLTNVERDHHHTFISDEDLDEFFLDWLAVSATDGKLDHIIVGPNERAQRIVMQSEKSGVLNGCQITVVSPQHVDDLLEDCEIGVAGEHNRQNAAVAIEACIASGVNRHAAQEAIGHYSGIGRRFELRGTVGGVTVVDDYAHHPTEVSAVLEAARRQFPGKRCAVIFQPHLFSRTRELLDEFAQVLATSDRLLLLPIYGAREVDDGTVSSSVLAAAIEDLNPGVCAGVFEVAPATGDMSTIMSAIQGFDVVLTVGAGDVTQLASRVVDHLKEVGA